MSSEFLQGVDGICITIIGIMVSTDDVDFDAHLK
jgi:hypothetical protein